MSRAIEIVDDPNHPEGGHALIRFRGFTPSTSRVILEIDSLTEGFDYRGPRRVESETITHEGDLNVRVGPEVVGNLKPGVAVNISVQGADVESDVLWPSLTPPRASPRRRAMLVAAPRRVVAESAPQTLIEQEPNPPPTKREPPPSEKRTTAALRQDLPVNPEPDVVALDVDTPQREAPPESEPPAGPPGPDVTPVVAAERPKGWQTGGVALVAGLAFLLGAGATGLTWLLVPASPPKIVTAGTDVSLPSPYALLDDLSDHAPDGTPVNPGDGAAFRRRSEAASSEQNASFWRRWATRSLLNSKANDAAATLNDFALDLVDARQEKPDLAAARFIWEMAAVARDCAAMDNIVTALKAEAKGSQEIAIWEGRATTCHRERVSNH